MKIKLRLFWLFCMLYTTNNAQQSLDQIARSWITQHYAHKSQKRSLDTLALIATRSGPSGHTLRYQPLFNNIPLYHTEITIHISNDQEVTYALDYTPKKIDLNPISFKKISNRDAIRIAKKHLNAKSPIINETSKLYVYTEGPQTTLAYVVHIKANMPVGYWEVVIDARTKAILSTKEVSVCGAASMHKHHSSTLSNRRSQPIQYSDDVRPLQPVNGSGFVFDPDPLSVSNATYGGIYSDNNDQDNAPLNDARRRVTLRDIDFTDDIYTLKGPYVAIQDFDAPFKGLFTQNTPNFEFTRSEDGFEAVNCYYHIDSNMRYINETLNIPLRSIYNNGIILFDPSGWGGKDQSSYQRGMLSFGEGNVDDAEDADVIIHELGHGIHDWLTQGSLSQVEGLSEGCGDYWAQSYSRSLKHWKPTDEEYDYLFNWDGHNEFWDGRITNTTATYPEGLINSINNDGMIWATALMSIYDILGRKKTDLAFLEGIAMTNSITNQQQAAIAVRQAAIDMNYDIRDIVVITEQFTAIGYELPTLNFEDNINITPNPASSQITINGLFTNEEEVYITTISGQTILEQTISIEESTIDISALQQGVYLLLFKNRDKQLKFIKN